MDTSTVFALRRQAKILSGEEKLNKLKEALGWAQVLLGDSPSDPWAQSACAWVLIDLCKSLVAVDNLKQAAFYYNQLVSISFGVEDTLIEGQKNYLRPKIDTNYAEVKQAEQLSKDGNHIRSLAIFKSLIAENKLTDVHHASYGWTIYRLISAKENTLTSTEIRTWLRDYIGLKNDRPSLLHSMVLNFSLFYSKDHPDFNLYNFFKLWDPANLRTEDKKKQFHEGKEFPSLLSRLLKELVRKEYELDVDYLTSHIRLDFDFSGSERDQSVIDLLRESYFWDLYNAHREARWNDLWSLFDKYNEKYSRYGKSAWHSKILSLAERFMEENNEWRFLPFFLTWNPENLLESDWRETRKGEEVYKPVAIKAIKKAFETIKGLQNMQDPIVWLLQAYDKAIRLFPKDDWLLRDKALLSKKTGDLNNAIAIYRKLALTLGDKFYIWSEFASCFPTDPELRIGMLSRALQAEKNEDFLGDIHLELAKALIEKDMLVHALIELRSYQTHREMMGWRLSEIFNELMTGVINTEPGSGSNQEVYRKFIPLAEEFAYSDIAWVEVAVTDIWRSENNKEKFGFSNGRGLAFSVSKRRFESLKNGRPGNIFEFKVFAKDVGNFLPLLCRRSDAPEWSILEDEYAIVEYINQEKGFIHMITAKSEEVYLKRERDEFNVGQIVRGKKLIVKRSEQVRTELKNITKIDKAIGIEHFTSYVVVVDHVNHGRKLFHFAGKGVDGIIRFDETILRPGEGDFLEVWLVLKREKDNRTFFRAIEVKETDKIADELVKNIEGIVELKYKLGSRTIDYSALEDDDLSALKPAFGFIGDFYVPKYILEEYKIFRNCHVSARAIFTRDSWKVIKINLKPQ